MNIHLAFFWLPAVVHIQSFYRAMHFSANHGIAIACRPSVCLSVTLVNQDHIRSKSRKLIARTSSPTPSLFVAQRTSTYSEGNMGNLGETRGGVGKNGVLEHKRGDISETRTDGGIVTMGSL